MATHIRGLLEVSGIAEHFPQNARSFAQLQLQHNISLTPHHPDLESILRVFCDIKILHTRLYATPIRSALEGPRLTGLKLSVSGDLNTKIEYISKIASQPLHSLRESIPFSTGIVLPPDCQSHQSFFVTPYIEDISVHRIHERSIYLAVLLFLDVTFCMPTAQERKQ